MVQEKINKIESYIKILYEACPNPKIEKAMTKACLTCFARVALCAVEDGNIWQEMVLISNCKINKPNN